MHANPLKIPKKSPTFHDFPYAGEDRKCPHLWILNVTPPGAPHCVHNCPFCYARWGIYGDRHWSGPLKFYSNLPELIEKEVKNLYIVPPVSISNITDPCQEVPELRKEVARLMKSLFKKGFTVLVCTKGDARFIAETALETGHSRLVVQVSIEGPQEILNLTSPGALPFERRLQVIRRISELGFFTIVRIDPFFPHLWKGIYRKTWRKKLSEFINQIKEAGAKHVISSTGRFYGRTFIGAGGEKLGNDFEKFLDLCEKLGLDKKAVRSDFERASVSCVRGIWLKKELADEIHEHLYTLVKNSRMTYATCQDPSDFHPEENLPSCYGVNLPFCINEGFRLKPISGCSGNCITCKNAPSICRHLQGRKEPLKKSLLSKKAFLTRLQPHSLLGEASAK